MILTTKLTQTAVEIEAGAEALIPMALIKEYAGIDGDLDAEATATLKTLRQAAIETGEQETGLVWARAGYQAVFNKGGLAFWGLVLPVSPVFEIIEVKTVDQAGQETLVPETGWSVTLSSLEAGIHRPWACLGLKEGWPADLQSLAISFTAGWAGDYFPQALRSWALIRIATMFEQKLDLTDSRVNKAPRHHAERLLDRFRVV